METLTAALNYRSAALEAAERAADEAARVAEECEGDHTPDPFCYDCVMTGRYQGPNA